MPSVRRTQDPATLRKAVQHQAVSVPCVFEAIEPAVAGRRAAIHDEQSRPTGAGHFDPRRPQGVFTGGQVFFLKAVLAEQLPGDALCLAVVIAKFDFVNVGGVLPSGG